MRLNVDVPQESLISPNTANRGHIGFFDGLRGVLCLWIFIFHAANMVAFNTRLIPPGPIAVDLFMLISGFLMTFTLSFDQKQQYPLSTAKIMEFYFKRITRIVPVYYLVLLFAIMFYASFSQFSREATAAFPPLWAAHMGNDPSIRTITPTNVLLHMTFLFGLNPRYASNMPIPDWSLALEMQFYAVVPFLLMAMRKYGLTLPIAGLAIINFLVLRYVGLYLSPKIGGLWPQPSMLFFKIDCFVTGMLLALYFIDRRVNKVEILSLLIILIYLESSLIFALVVVLCFSLLFNSRTKQGFFSNLCNYFNTLLQSKPIVFLGDISYNLYLLHLPMLYFVVHHLLKNAWYIPCAPVLRFGLLLGISAILVVPASYLVHIFVERPCQKAARPIFAWIFGRNSHSKRNALNPGHLTL